MKTKINAWKIIFSVLIALTILGIVKALFVSLDVDESYAVAQAYRLVTGDRLMYDMWEPHQFSAFLPAFFLYPFYMIRKNADYCVIYLRLVGILIHLATGVFLWLTAKKKTGNIIADIIFIIHMNFLPKWVAMPEFELMHYWSMLLVFLILYSAEERKKVFLYFPAGLIFGVSVLCYPTMVLVFPFFIIALIVRKKAGGVLPFVFGTAVTGIATLAVILINVPFSELPFFISYILMDSSHTSAGMAYKTGTSLEQLKVQMTEAGIGTAISVIIALAVRVSDGSFKKKEVKVNSFVSDILTILSTGLCILTFIRFVFMNENQFCMQIRYMVLVLLFVVLALKDRKKFGAELWYGLIPGILSIPAVFIITNMDINSVYVKAFSAVVAGMFILGRNYEESREKSSLKVTDIVIDSALAASILLCLFTCRLLLIRVNGCLPVTVMAKTAKVENGPAAGVYVLKDQADAWNSSYESIKDIVDSGKNVLYIGQEQLFYVTFCERVNVPSVQGTTVFNGMYERYYEVFPEKYPEIIVKDASFGSNPAYYYSPENEYIYTWITDNNGTKTILNNGYYEILSVIRK